MSGLPRALVIAAQYDTLRDETAAYAEKLRSAGVDATYSCYAGMIHGFLGMGGLVQEAQRAIDEIARVLNRRQVYQQRGTRPHCGGWAFLLQSLIAGRWALPRTPGRAGVGWTAPLAKNARGRAPLATPLPGAARLETGAPVSRRRSPSA